VTYIPNPIDTSSIELVAELEALTERLAKNTHAQWAWQRMRDGWIYGPQRDDNLRTHPCLIPYHELPENEKEYDRITAIETVKVMLDLGYRITPPESNVALGVDGLTEPDEGLYVILDMLKNPDGLDLSILRSLWNNRRPEWENNLEFVRIIAERFTNLGEPLLAYDVLTGAPDHMANDVRLRQLRAFALARSGAAEKATEILSQLLDEGHNDAETLGLLGRTFKDMWEWEKVVPQKQRFLDKAFHTYQHAYDLTDTYWTGINAAALGLLRGNLDQARKIALRVADQANDDLESTKESDGDQYWPLATLGETSLILGDVTAAAIWYERAAKVGRGRFGDLQSTRRNAMLIVQHTGEGSEILDRCFPIPAITFARFVPMNESVSGVSRFQNDLLDGCIVDVEKRLSSLDTQLAFAAATELEELAIVAALVPRVSELYAVIPCDLGDYISNISTERSEVRDRIEVILKQTSEIIPASHQRVPNLIAAVYTRRVAEGLARIRAQQIGANLNVIDFDLAQQEPTQDVSDTDESSSFPTEIMSYLFADAVGFSKFTNDQIPLFVSLFLTLVSETVTTGEYAPVTKNTWGDGIHMVFGKESEAAMFALDLRDRVEEVDWAAYGLPSDFSLRIALHAGPAYRCVDPVTGHEGFFGVHVSHTARIEPIAPPGEVYSSLPFAALLAQSQSDDIRCTYVGQTPWAKGYGTFPTYHLRRV
jgi:class 3 adenylate cyclase